MSKRILVAGTAGGVGTTTVTALLFTALGADGTAPALVDHSRGELGLRLTAGDEASTIDDGLLLHDCGPTAFSAAIDELGSPDVFVILVAASTPAGMASATRFLTRVRDRHGAGGLRRVLVAVVGVFGRHRVTGLIEKLHDDFGRKTVVVIPRDLALASGGRIPQSRLGVETRRAQTQLLALLRGRLATQRSAG